MGLVSIFFFFVLTCITVILTSYMIGHPAKDDIHDGPGAQG